MKLVSENNCTGCMACYNTCKNGAIEICQNEKGFYIPQIVGDKCSNCGRCLANCPQAGDICKNDVHSVFAAWNKDLIERRKSSSGGIAFLLAQRHLSTFGIVYGVGIIDNVVRFIRIDTIEKLHLIQGSKYVQAYVGDIFQCAKTDLDNGKQVLFFGTACQIAGLNKYLGTLYANLTTVDILCHGAPSPKVFEDYLNNFDKAIQSINFRCKEHNWTTFDIQIDFADGSSYKCSKLSDPYMRGFLGELTTNKVCGSCKYTSKSRVSDITLGDFWGYISESRKYKNTEDGISMVMTNSDKGMHTFCDIKDDILWTEKTFEEASHGNKILVRPFAHSDKYDEFWDCYVKKGYISASKYFKPTKEGAKRMLSLFMNDHAFLLPKPIKTAFYYIKKKVRNG